MENENKTEVHRQEPQLQPPPHHHLKFKQANEITLERIKSAVEAAQEPQPQPQLQPPQKHKHNEAGWGEREHLLGGQLQEEDEAETAVKQQQLLIKTENTRVNCKEDATHVGELADDVDSSGESVADYDENGIELITAADAVFEDGALAAAAAAAAKKLQLQEVKADKMTQYGNTGSHAHSQLDIQKIPEETQQQNQQHKSNNQPNATTIILAPTSLNAQTATATRKISSTQIGNAGGVGNFGGDSGSHNNPAHISHGYHAYHHYKGPKIWRYLVRHWPEISQPLALLGIFLGLWALGYILLPDYAQPQTAIMRIAFLFVGAQLAGMLVQFVGLPDMLGMLFFGVLYTNVGLADFSGYGRFEAFLREMALINIMLLAGLGLDAKVFKKLWLMNLRLTLVPTIAEVTIVAVLARYLLAMPWIWGILLGLVITAVSPNVVVTVMLKLKEERLGLNNGIHTLIYAMTTCNDVIAIFLFGVILGLIFSTGSLTQQILQGPIGIGIGIVFGYVYGLMLTFVPSKKTQYLNGLRFVLTILGGTIAVMGSKAIGYPSAGALGCATITFFAGIGWKRQQEKQIKQQQQEQQQHANENSSVSKRLDLLWKFLKPVSFALIGKEINFAVLDGKVVGYGALLVLLGSLFRLAFAYISTYGGNLSRKERAYITISGFPKATVQAALGPIAMDLARSLNAGQENLSLANNVLVISVLAIIFTAPLGAILMLRLAPHWLQRSSGDSITSDSSTLDVGNNARGSGGIGAGNVRV